MNIKRENLCPPSKFEAQGLMIYKENKVAGSEALGTKIEMGGCVFVCDLINFYFWVARFFLLVFLS